MRDPTLLYPISRTERRENFDQMLAEDKRNDELLYRQTDAMPAESENFALTEEVSSDPAPQQPQEEIRLHNLVIDLTGQKTERKEAEPYKAQNFHITNDHLGEGGAKTKYAFNIAAIQTLKQIEADGRQRARTSRKSSPDTSAGAVCRRHSTPKTRAGKRNISSSKAS